MKRKEIENKIKEILARDNNSDIHYIEFEPGTFVVEYDDGKTDFSKLEFHKNGTPRFSFTITGGLNGNGQWEDYAKDLSEKFKELKDETGLELEIEKIQNDIADDVWTAQCFLYDINNIVKDSWSNTIIDLQGLSGKKVNKIIKYLNENRLNWDWYRSTDIQVLDLSDSDYRNLAGFLYDLEENDFKDSIEDEINPEKINELIDVEHYVVGKNGIWFAKPKNEKENFTKAYISIDQGQHWYPAHIEAKREAPSGRSQVGKIIIRGTIAGKSYSIGRNVLTWYANNNIHEVDYSKEIDHINGEYTDDSLSNLRRVSPSENIRFRNEMIRNINLAQDSKISDIIKKKPEGYIIYSHKGKRLSKAYKTREEAEKRLKEIEMFKHMNDALEHPDLYGKKIKLVVNNALSSQIDRMYGNEIISRKVYDKNKIEYILPYDGRFEYFNRRFHKKYDIVDSARVEFFEAKPDKGHYNIYYKGELIGSADNEKEAEEEIKHLANRKYVVVWETSASDVFGKKVVYAIDEKEAIKKARKIGGWEMPKDDNELLVRLIEDSFKRR